MERPTKSAIYIRIGNQISELIYSIISPISRNSRVLFSTSLNINLIFGGGGGVDTSQLPKIEINVNLKNLNSTTTIIE